MSFKHTNDQQQTTPAREITVQVPEDRVEQFEAFVQRFLAHSEARSGRGRHHRGRGMGIGPGRGFGLGGGCRGRRGRTSEENVTEI